MPNDLPLERAYALALKIQPVRGTYDAPTLADHALRLAEPFAIGVDWVSANMNEGEQTGGKGTFPSSARAGRIHTLPIARRIRGTGVAYGAAALPKEDALWMAILGNRVVVEGTSITYNGVDEGEAILSVLAQTLKKQFTTHTVVPRAASIEWEAGKVPILRTELAGVGVAPTQQALQAATLDTPVPRPLKGGTHTLGGTALTPIKGSLDFGLTISEAILDGTAGDAWAGYIITDRSVKGNLEVQIPDLATFDPYVQMASAAQLAWILDWGAAQFFNFRIEADRLEITAVKEVNRGGLKAYSLDFVINRAASGSVKDPIIVYN